MRLALLLSFLVAWAGAAIIHVPGQYPTIQQGIDAARAGDIVLVAAGTYPEEIDLKAGVVVRGAGEGRSIIDGGGDAGDVVSGVGNAIGPDTKLEGFTVTGAANSGGMPGGGGVFCNSGARPDINNCRITGNDQGVSLWNGSAAIVRNCVVIYNTYDGVSVGSYATVVNNTIHGNRIGFYDYSGYGPVFMNNIVTGQSLYGIYGPSGGAPPSLTYNDVWDNAINYQQATPGVGSDSLDPIFVDTLARDFHLGPGSPCIDYGNPDPQYNDPDGTRNDMGAYGGPGAGSNLPQLTTLVPAPNQLNVAVSTSAAAGFNMAMDPASFNGQTFVMRGLFSGTCSGPVSYDTAANMATLDPSDSLWPGEPATLTLSHGVRTGTGDTFPGYSWQFTARVPGGSGRFSDTSRVNPWGNTTWLATADFNSDNNLDFVLVRDNANQVGVYLGNGDGRFQAARNFSVGISPRACVCADLNSDSILDIATANASSHNVSVLIGQGNGDFDPAVNYACGNLPLDLASGDFDFDGDVDLAAAASGADAVVILDNNGDGTFAAPRTFAVAGVPGAIAVADMNNDGKPDLLTANYGSDDISILKGNGDGTFDSLDRYPAGTTPCFIRAEDFNEDGNLDVVAVNMESNNISVWPGDGSGGLGSRTNYNVGESPRQVVVADLDADGHLDLAVTNKVGNSVTTFAGSGGGTFGNPRTWDPDNDPYSITPGDFDEDGDLDLAVGNYSPQQITIMLNDDALAAVSVAPDQYEVGAEDSTSVSAVFNQQLNPATLDSTSFRICAAQTGIHRGSIGYDSATFCATLNPASDFATGEPVSAILTTDIAARTGVNLKGFVWNFTTGIRSGSGGGFANQSSYATGAEPRGACCADFDSDGDIDIATTSNAPSAVALLKNNGNGTFASPTYTGVAGDPISLFSADFDSDSDMDIAVYHNEPGTSHLEILKNDGSGAFSVTATYVPAVLGQQVSGGDFDADGDIDLVLSDGWGSQNNVRVMTNNGTGAFSGPVNYSAGSWARGIAVIDADNDGDLDVAVTNQGNANVSILLNSGSGIFAGMANYGCGSNPDGVCANDLNGDGWVDMAVTSMADSSVAVLLNNGDGTFAQPSLFPAGGTTRAAIGGDFNGDNDIDLALVSYSSAAGVVLANNGDGTFAAPVTYATGTNPWSIGSADFNRDGALDLALSCYGSNAVSVLLATGLGVAEGPGWNSAEPALKAFPNPSSGLVQLRFSSRLRGPSILRVFDASGRLVLNPSLVIGNSSFSVDLRSLSAGVYLFRLEEGRTSVVEKVVLTR